MMFRALVRALTHFGFPGVLVLFDEVEATLDQSERIRQNAYDNLRFIVDLAQLPPRLMIVASVSGGGFATRKLFSDDDAGFPSYPALWQRVGGFDLPGVVFDAPVADLGQTPLRAQDYFTLGNEIRQIHALGYGGEAENRVDDAYLKAAAEQAARARGLSVAATWFFRP